MNTNSTEKQYRPQRSIDQQDIENPRPNRYKNEAQEVTPSDPKMTRRSFLKGLTLGAAAGAAEVAIEPVIKESRRIKKLVQSIKAMQERGGSNSEKREIKNIGDHYFYAYTDLRNTEDYWPNDVFTDDLLIAQKLQESGYNRKAESKKGARGVMQTMPFTPADITNYLNLLRYNKVLTSYQGPSRLSKEQAEEMNELVDQKKYSNSLGKINMMKLWDKNSYVYDLKGRKVKQKGVGREEYERGDIKGAQEQVLASYNAGPGAIQGRSKKRWPRESRKYIDHIFYYMDDIQQVRQDYQEAGIEFRGRGDENYATMLMVRKMNDAAGKWKTNTWKKNRDTLKSMYLNKISRIFHEVNKQSDNAEDYYFDHEELRKLFEKL